MVHSGIRSSLLLVGDLAVFAVSLLLTLLIRYRGLPEDTLIIEHIATFAFLFFIWVLVFYIVGLYGKSVMLLKSRWPQALLRTQVFNVLLAALFFFIAPYVAIEPKGSLILYLFISVVLIFAWRIFIYPALSKRPLRMRALLMGSGEEVNELKKEIEMHSRYPFIIVEHIESTRCVPEFADTVLSDNSVEVIIADMQDTNVKACITGWYIRKHNPVTTPIYSFTEVYEEVFERVALSHVDHYALIKRAQNTPIHYRLIKRAIDIVGGIALMVLCALSLPFVLLANILEKNGRGLFIIQKRFGMRGTLMDVYKLRTMLFNDQRSGSWVGEHTENKVTKTGDFLRKTSIDEFPQALNILKGELSLIGPRTDIQGLGERLRQELPHYDMRYLVTPGITGWAQITQQYEEGHTSPQSVAETRMRLAYDFYYIQKRSLSLDIVIALKTLKRLFVRTA